MLGIQGLSDPKEKAFLRSLGELMTDFCRSDRYIVLSICDRNYPIRLELAFLVFMNKTYHCIKPDALEHMNSVCSKARGFIVPY